MVRRIIMGGRIIKGGWIIMGGVVGPTPCCENLTFGTRWQREKVAFRSSVVH